MITQVRVAALWTDQAGPGAADQRMHAIWGTPGNAYTEQGDTYTEQGDAYTNS